MVISCRHGSWEWSAGHIWATTALPKPAPSKPASSSAQHKLITFHCPPRNTPERCSWASRAGNRTFDPSKCVQRQIFRRRRVPTGRLLAFNAKPGSFFHSKITCNGNGHPTLLTVTQIPDVILLAWLPLIMVLLVAKIGVTTKNSPYSGPPIYPSEIGLPLDLRRDRRPDPLSEFHLSSHRTRKPAFASFLNRFCADARSF